MGKIYIILIVDDIKENRLLLRKIIESMDYNVQEAANGKEGLEIARLHKPDLIISDILMPVMDGFQLCRKVKADNELKNTPFIFYTATYTSKKDEEFALSLGAEKFIRKPTEPVEFIKIIQSIVKDVEKGKVKIKEQSLKEDKEVFKLYSERLVNELEKKMLDLEKEIAKRKETENKLKHLNLILRSVRGVNQLITKEKNRDTLLKKSCEILIQNHGYYNSWIVLLSKDKKFEFAAEAGLGENFQPLLKKLKKGDLTVCGKKALDQIEPVLINDPAIDCKDCPLSGINKGRGGITFRLECNNKVYGLISASIEKDFLYDKKMQSLFKEVSEDIAFALYRLELEEEHKLSEDRIKKSEEKYRILTNTISDIVFTLDKKGKFTYLNPTFEKVTNYLVRDFLGHSVTEVIAPEYIESTVDRFKSGIAGETVLLYEIEFLNKDGKKIPIELNMTSLFDADGQLIGMLGVARDITERKRAQKIQKTLYNISNALNTTDKMHELYNKIREYLGNVIDTANLYIAFYDREQDLVSFDYYIDEFVKEKDTIVYRKLGKGLTDYVIRTGKPLLATEKVLEKLVHSGEVEMIGATSKIWLGVPLKVEDQVIGVIAVQSYDDPHLYTEKDIEILTFISEELALAIKNKQAEENLQKAHKELKELHKGLEIKVKKAVKELREKDNIIYQQSRLASMGEMISNIAHHWRQPITAVGAIVQNYEDVYEDGRLDLEYLEEHSEIVMDILTKMSRTIDNFRFFFKPDKAKKNFDIREIILKTLKFLDSSFKYSKITVSSNLAEDCIINGFPNEYSQVLLIVLANAKDELVEREIKDRKITILLEKIEDKVVVTISDNAGGITKEVLPKVFEPYFTTKEQGKGTGIGLYMAKMIIERNMAGKLTTRNLKDGAEFRIEV